MTGLEPATPGATVPKSRIQEVAASRVVSTDLDLCDFEERWSDPVIHSEELVRAYMAQSEGTEPGAYSAVDL